MPEIHLPTKTTQDQIKSGIDTLLGGRVIKSLQRGNSVFGSDQNTLTVNISNVNTNKALLVFSNTGAGTSSAGNAYGLVKGELINTSTLNFKVTLPATTNTVQISWQVIEFY